MGYRQTIERGTAELAVKWVPPPNRPWMAIDSGFADRHMK